jgi:large subunit ribosomal protein L4
MTSKNKLYDFEGKELNDISVDVLSIDARSHYQSIKDYITAIRKNARQWSACTKDRSQLNHSGAKPHNQKGTGKARQGSLGAPQYKGGGRVHTPKPKFDQHVKINKKERRQAIATLLSERTENGRVYFLKDEVEKTLASPKTAVFAKLLKTLEIGNKSCLFVADKNDEKSMVNFQKSLKNLPRVSFLYVDNLNGYTVVAHQYIVVLDSAMDKFKELLRG